MNIITTPINKHGFEFADGQHHVITDTIVDFSNVPLSEIDEAVSVVWGSSAEFRNCLIRGAGKLVLIGSGDADKREIEQGKQAYFKDCIFENFCRRGVEVQSGMLAIIDCCVIRNWGDPARFDTRSFASWRHDGALLSIASSVFYQDSYRRPLRQWVTDHLNHIGQAWNDDGILGLLNPDTYISGVRRAEQKNGYVWYKSPLKADLTPPELAFIKRIEAPFMDYYRSIGVKP